MHSLRIDLASECITSLQGILQVLMKTQAGLDPGLLHQYLDDASLYLKQVPRVRVVVISRINSTSIAPSLTLFTFRKRTTKGCSITMWGR